MKSFNDVLQDLNSVDHIKRLTLRYEDGKIAGEIVNKAGSQGSLKVYYHLYQTFGSISTDAAIAGIKLFAEYAQDAIDNPDKHPNINRLLAIIENNRPLTVETVSA